MKQFTVLKNNGDLMKRLGYFSHESLASQSNDFFKSPWTYYVFFIEPAFILSTGVFMWQNVTSQLNTVLRTGIVLLGESQSFGVFNSIGNQMQNIKTMHLKLQKIVDESAQVPPSVKAVNHVVGPPVESHVLLECIVEVFPKPLNGWYRNEGSLKLHDGPKYIISERLINGYMWQLNLTIKNLQKSDFGEYTCTSVNALGKQDARIRLQELKLITRPVTTTTPTPYVHTTKRKHQSKPNNKGSHNHDSSSRGKDAQKANTLAENDIHGQRAGAGGSFEVYTQGPGGYGGGVGVSGPGSANSGNNVNSIDKSRTSQNGKSGDMPSNRQNMFPYPSSMNSVKSTTNLGDFALLSICISVILVSSL